jgi:histidyl-tRNA synthetase
MFRHERPQKGRYRQFTQFGVEAFGIANCHIEVELIALSYRLWQQLGFDDEVQLQVNSLGELSEREAYKIELIAYFQQHRDHLDEDSKRRLTKNPLRILDSKNPEMAQIIANSPKLIDALGVESKARFEAFCSGLDQLRIPYKLNPVLVRGLDYYGHTVFEWVTNKLGSQSTVCAGGRYDQLVEQLGGTATPAVGFALGMERIILLMETLARTELPEKRQSLFIVAPSDEAIKTALIVAESIRTTHPHVEVILNLLGGSFKSQFKKADKSGARLALIIGDDELAKKTIRIKELRHETEQITVEQKSINQFLTNYLASGAGERNVSVHDGR